MFQKKIAVVLFLALFFSNCANKNEDKSLNNALLLAALQSKDPGISGIYAALSVLSTTNNPGQRGAYSRGNASPFAIRTQSINCASGGKMTLSGDYTSNQTANGFSMQYTGTKMTFENCQQMAPTMQSGGTSLVKIEGEVTLDGNAEIVMDGNLNPNVPMTEMKYTTNSTQRMRTDSYTINGFVYPKIDLTFTSNNAKYSFANMDDIDKMTITIEETVEITGTIGEEKVKDSQTYKSTAKLK
ncbi:sigma factor SigX-regulated lipoprotein [Leptospira alexanderi]|uniref:sigma factor SigX-regulated lipoprotein n=1 Tax=Leptospira alexanderi TaxID=100053 RepID=UPI0009913EB4|nr:type 4 pilus major pilin [Leptospira alexanderi]